MSDFHHEILLEVGALPTAPFVEHAVNAYVRRFVDSRGRLKLAADRWGNLLVSYANGPRPRGGPLWFAAHTDHPGFIAQRMTGRNKLLAQWLGGVALPFFRQADVRFYVIAPGHAQCHVERIVPGRITSVVAKDTNGDIRPHLRKRVQAAYVEVAEPVPPGTIGMWYLPDPRLAKGQVFARAHDDLSQVAAMLCLLDELDRKRPAGHVTCAFTRAEEVGFVGAIGLAMEKVLPADACYVSLESSDARAAGVSAGDGPIVRVGDLVATFDQVTLSWMNNVAKDLARSQPGFRWQRKLMPGGTCESTAVLAFGHVTGALCLPLLNYHNMGLSGRVESEIISLDDFDHEVTLLLALVAQSARRTTTNKALAKRLADRFRTNRPMLRKWAP